MKRTFRRWIAIPSVRALLALALVVMIGSIYNADGAFFR